MRTKFGRFFEKYSYEQKHKTQKRAKLTTPCTDVRFNPWSAWKQPVDHAFLYL